MQPIVRLLAGVHGETRFRKGLVWASQSLSPRSRLRADLRRHEANSSWNDSLPVFNDPHAWNASPMPQPRIGQIAQLTVPTVTKLIPTKSVLITM